MALPWTVEHFITTDGPSHLYGGTVFRNLLLHHQSSIYSPIYTVQRTVLPNWTTTIVLGAAGALVGTAHAEQLFASLAVLCGFLGLCYVSRALAPQGNSPMPLMNHAWQSWFLWVGFYNFYLGMVLLRCSWVTASAGSERLDWRRAVVIALGLVALFFTHLIVVALAIATIVSLGAWAWIARPLLAPRNEPHSRRPSREGCAQFALLLAATLPAICLILIYVHGAPAAPKLIEFAKDWRSFPQHIFWTGQGAAGHQSLMRYFALCYIAAGALLMTRAEWASPRGGLVIAMLAAFAGYIYCGRRFRRFGGQNPLCMGRLRAGNSRSPRAPRGSRLFAAPAALCMFLFLVANSVATAQEAQALSRASSSYLQAAGQVASGASVVRLNYKAPQAASHGYDGNAIGPFILTASPPR